MEQRICNICLRRAHLRKDGKIRSHHPPFNGVGTLECKGSYTLNYRLIYVEKVEEIKKVKEIKKENNIPQRQIKMTAEDFKEIQQKEFNDLQEKMKSKNYQNLSLVSEI